MSEVLFNFYPGNINPSEGTYQKGVKYQKAIKQVCSIETALLSHLGETGQEFYRQLAFDIVTRDNIGNVRIFSDAFRLRLNSTLACLWEGVDG